MFMDGDDNEVANPDPEAGLYIQSRDGSLVKAIVPHDVAAFQIGETSLYEHITKMCVCVIGFCWSQCAFGWSPSGHSTFRQRRESPKS